jgi:sortase (surface protein transpeptidase)
MTGRSWRIPPAVLVGGALIGVVAGGSAPAAGPVDVVGPVSAASAGPGPTRPVPGSPIEPPGMARPLDDTAVPPRAPTAIRIPAIGVDHELVPLAVDAAGVLVPPTSAAVPGWFAAGVVPGEIGPAVIAGHVDSRSGPGVFYRLHDLRPGDRIEVQRSDGVALFQVRTTERVGKREFPSRSVYGPVPVPELRLITCGGAFSRSTGHYVDNVIVRAVLVGAPTTSPHPEGGRP